MPNWCSNYLSVSGKEPELKKFRDEVKSETSWFDFDTFLPCPQELRDRTAPNSVDPKEMKKKYGHEDWWPWQIAHWGTKWRVECEEPESNVDKDNKLIGLYYRFDSAWSPPIPAIYTASEKWPELTFNLNYEEIEGVFFKGQFKAKSGNVIEDWSKEIEMIECPECEGFYDKDDSPDECPFCDCNKKAQEAIERQKKANKKT